MSHSHPTKSPPPPTPTFLKLTFPAPRVLLIRMDRPKALNAMTTAAQWEMDSVWKWFDAEPNLSIAILTGTGRAFSAGADLKEWNGSMAPDADPSKRMGKAPEFTPLSRRMGKKPVIAAVNGLAMGGGCEFVVNCDIVLATEEATFGLPEVKRGVAAIGGALPRLIRNIGLQRASEFALTGRTATAAELESWGIVNKIVPKDRDLIKEAVSLAATIAENSPDSIICTRAGLRQGWQTDVETAVSETLSKEFEELQRGENILEGLKAFTEKRKPVWKGSRL